MKPRRPKQIGKTLGIMGIVTTLISPFLPWVVTDTTSITLVQTGWWMALLPAIFVGFSGLMDYFNRRLNTLVLFLSGILVVVTNVVILTVMLPPEANTFALGFYTSLGSASLLIEGGIITYIEEIKRRPPVNAKPPMPSGVCPWCASDIHLAPPSPRFCPICESLASDERAVEPDRKEVVVVVSRLSSNVEDEAEIKGIDLAMRNVVEDITDTVTFEFAAKLEGRGITLGEEVI